MDIISVYLINEIKQYNNYIHKIIRTFYRNSYKILMINLININSKV